jgi:hypothetical protein
VSDSLSSLVGALNEAGEQRSLVVLQSGTLEITLPGINDKDASSPNQVRSIVLHPGDVLGGLAVRIVAASLRRQLVESKRASKRKVSLLVLSQEQVGSIVPDRLQREAEYCCLRKILHAMELFQALLPHELDSIIRVGASQTFKAGTVISSEGEVHDGFYIVLEGLACASRATGTGQATVSDGDTFALSDANPATDYFACGDHFGGVCLLEPEKPRRSTVTAETDLTCLTLSRSDLGSFEQHVKHYLARELSTRRWILEYRDKVHMSELAFGVALGEGAFGRVKIVQQRSTEKTFALKCLTKSHIVAEDQVEHVASERKILTMCNHPFLLKMLGAFQDSTELYFLLELVPGGELLALLRNKGAFGTGSARFYAASVVSALQYLNSLSIVYRDIKMENIMMDGSGYAKMVDLGFAKVIQEHAFTFCGTPDYMPPEMIVCKPHGLPCDWWSVGVLIYEMMVGKPPFTASKTSAIFKNTLKYVETGKMNFPFLFNAFAKDLILKLLNPDPQTRLNAVECMEHPFFWGVDFVGLQERKVRPPFVPNIKGAAKSETGEDMPFEEVDQEEEEEDESWSPRTIKLAERTSFSGFLTIADGNSELLEA